MENLHLAVLIDGDNIPSAYVKELLEEVAKYGNPTLKRIYGDWTKPSLVKWKKVLLENAITPIQQYGYTTGKNATDSAMIIDAMDILYSEKVKGFFFGIKRQRFYQTCYSTERSGYDCLRGRRKENPQSLYSGM